MPPSKEGSQKCGKNKQRAQREGGDKRVSGGVQRHFRYIEQVLCKCLPPSPAEQKTGWEPAETREGRPEGGG